MIKVTIDNITYEYDENGCGSNSCHIKKPNGQGTNGPCTCLRQYKLSDRIIILKYLQGKET